MANSNAIAPESNVHALVPIQRGTLSGVSADLVDARTLHVYLESRRQFSDWMIQRIVKYGFEEGVDYTIASQKSEAKRGGSNRIDYLVTLDVAKELSMVENNEKGRNARRYFIACEKRLQQIAPQEASTIMGQTIGTDGFHMLGAVVKGKVVGLPKHAQRRATSKIWSQTHAAFGVRSAADIPAEQLDAARNFIAAYVVIEGEYLQRSGRAGGVSLDQHETHCLYLLMSRFWTMHQHKLSMLNAARALGSDSLMSMFDQLHDGHISFATLDKRREEIYAAYTSTGCQGGYASRRSA